MCSTDSHVIANRAQELQIETFNRPEELVGDDVEISDVVIDFLHSIFRQEGVIAECIALLQPTSPFILPDQIDKLGPRLEILKKSLRDQLTTLH